MISLQLEASINSRVYLFLLGIFFLSLLFLTYSAISSVEKNFIRFKGSESSESFSALEWDVSAILDIASQGMFERDNSHRMTVLTIHRNFDRKFHDLLSTPDGMVQRRIRLFSRRFWRRIIPYERGELLDAEQVSLLRKEGIVLQRMIRLSRQKYHEDFRSGVQTSGMETSRILWTLLLLLFLGGFSAIITYSRHISKLRSVFAGIEKGGDDLFKGVSSFKESLEKELREVKRKQERGEFLQRRYREILNSITAGIVVVGSDETVSFVNSQLLDWFSMEGHFVGEPLELFLEAAGLDSLEGDRKVKGNRVFLVGSKDLDEMSVYIFQDVTERENISTRLLNSERLISMGEMASKVTHEIRNPLSTIKLNSEYLLENLKELDVENVSDSLALIVKEVVRLEEISGRYMGMVRYRASEEHARGTELPDDLMELIGFHSGEFERRKIMLTVGEIDPVMLSMPLSSFKEVMLNLLKNAWEEIGESGEIGVSCSRDGDGARIVVEDSGRGVPLDERSRIFDIFFTKKPGGTGIGLSHTRKRIEESGGKIVVEDSALGGARFVVTLPAETHVRTEAC